MPTHFAGPFALSTKIVDGKIIVTLKKPKSLDEDFVIRYDCDAKEAREFAKILLLGANVSDIKNPDSEFYKRGELISKKVCALLFLAEDTYDYTLQSCFGIMLNFPHDSDDQIQRMLYTWAMGYWRSF